MKFKFRVIRSKQGEKEVQAQFIAALLVIAFYTGMQAIGITCPIKYVTGISCVGCGMTRAYLALLHLRFKEAFYYHPLFWTLPFLFLCYRKKEKLNRQIYQMIFIFSIVLFAGVYFYRMFYGDGVVVSFRLQNSLICHLLSRWGKYLK